MSSRVYLDYAATAPLLPEVRRALDAFYDASSNEVGWQANANSLHSDGRKAFAALEDARARIASVLNVRPHELVFTGCATESSNAALTGIVLDVLKHKGQVPHIVTSTIEHDATFKTVQQLEKLGFCQASYVSPNRAGFVELESIKQAMRSDTTLVSLIVAHNETGAINDIARIGQYLSEQGVLFHIDAVQALGKMPFDLGTLPVDLASFSAHKIGGPKGIGLLAVKTGTNLVPLLSGGGQEAGLRSGTQNVAGAFAFAAACETACSDYSVLEAETQRLRNLRDFLYEQLSSLPRVHMTVPCDAGSKNYLPNIVNICVEDVESETLILQLDLNGFSVSGGSACSTHSLKPSRTLLELGIPRDLAQGALRISMGPQTSKEDIDSFIATFEKVLSSL